MADIGTTPLVTYNWNPATQLANYLAAQAAVVSGAAGKEAKIICVGDSTTLGFGGEPNDYRGTVSYPADLARDLSLGGVPAQSNNFLGQGNNDFTVPDARIKLVGGAAWGYPFVAGGPVVVTTGSGEGFDFTLSAPQAADHVDINYLDIGSGALSVSVDGGPALATLQLGNTGKMLTQDVALPLGPHSSLGVRTANGNNAYVEGASFWNSAAPAVQVLNAGEGGAETTVVGDGVTPGAGEISSAAAIGANLALINFGINDILQGNLTAAQTTSNIALMVSEFRSHGTDPVIIIPNPLAGSNYAAEISTLRADIHNLADAMNVPVIDLSATYGDNWAALASAGLMSDYAHPNAALYADIASGIAKLLAPAAGAPVPVVPTPPATGGGNPVPVVPPPPATAPVTIGSGPDAIVLGISEDAYLGDAQFTVAVDGAQVGGIQSATALHGAGQDQAFTAKGAFGAGQHAVTVDFLNDAYAGTPQTDRNLYVDTLSYGGATQATNAALLGGGPRSFTVGAASPPVAPPVAVPPPPGAVTIGSGPDILALAISEDAYQGDAQFTISVTACPSAGPRPPPRPMPPGPPKPTTCWAPSPAATRRR